MIQPQNEAFVSFGGVLYVELVELVWRYNKHVAGAQGVFAVFDDVRCRALQKKIDFGKVVRVHFDGFEILVLFVMHLKSGRAHLLIFVFVDFHKYII